MGVLLYIVFMDLDGLLIYSRYSFILFIYNRSPVLVAMALREAGMNRQESIDFVRARRRGSFNVRQLEFLQNYQSHHRLTHKHASCAIM
jgi:hypothetical protein